MVNWVRKRKSFPKLTASSKSEIIPGKMHFIGKLQNIPLPSILSSLKLDFGTTNCDTAFLLRFTSILLKQRTNTVMKRTIKRTAPHADPMIRVVLSSCIRRRPSDVSLQWICCKLVRLIASLSFILNFSNFFDSFTQNLGFKFPLKNENNEM